MDKVWIFFVLIAAASTYADSALRKESEAESQDLEKAYDDGWYQDELEQLGIINENGEDTDTDNTVESESGEFNEGDSIETGDYYDEFQEAADLQSIEKEASQNLEEEVQKISSEKAVNKLEDDNNAGEDFDANIDYQIEDNRLELKDEVLNKVLDTKIYKENDDAKEPNDNVNNSDFKDTNDLLEKNHEEVEEIDDSDEVPLVEDDNNGPNQSSEFDEDAELVDETKNILSNDNDDNDFSDLEAEASQQVEFKSDLTEETKNILKETDTFMDDKPNLTNDASMEAAKDQSLEVKVNSVDSIENVDEVAEDEEVEKIYADLQSDLDKLVDTWKKLQESDEDIKEKEDNPIDHEDVLDYEEKYGRPFKEGIVLQQRDYENVYDDNLSQLFEESKNASTENDSEEVTSTENDDDYEQVNDNNLSQIFEKTIGKSNSTSLTDDVAENDSQQKDEGNVELAVAEAQNKTDEEILYENDALLANDSVIMPNEVSEKTQGPESSEKNEINVHKVKEMDISELNADDLDQFMTQFDAVHNSNNLATDCDGNEGPIRKTLSIDEPLIISSCSFPDRYPTNKVMDWILDGAGQGMGIELNVTDLDLNGALGDYLMIKPGQVDASGQDGLVFSFHLDSQRNYRFLDVDRIFIRFEANPGMAFRTGFRLNVKLVEPPREIQPEVPPEFEALIPSPEETFTVNLGGVTLEEFLSIEEEFRRLVADMAFMYINANNISPGLNTTFESTQIVSRTICNIRWPNFEYCVEVKFGVPLVNDDGYDDEEQRLNEDDLTSMWNTYVGQDPFSARLRRMGIVEFAVPNDGSVLTVWVVVAIGVLISVAMLAFALWRFSCFEDYTRMAAYSDSDSFSNEKRGLDLYPTPHQTLPPLYSDADYKWADNGDHSTRVDMGSFANKSYVQDDLFNLDSDEEVIASRERSDKTLSGKISPRDLYAV